MFSKRKKLTKKQVVKAILTMGSLNSKLLIDKIGNVDSLVPMSKNKIMELDRILSNALKRVK
jgi:hypothetical protein